MNYKVSYYLMRILGICGIGLMVYAGLSGNTTVGIIGGVVTVLGAAQGSLFFNCPHCKRSLKMRNGIPDKCPYCKMTLD